MAQPKVVQLPRKRRKVTGNAGHLCSLTTGCVREVSPRRLGPSAFTWLVRAGSVDVFGLGVELAAARVVGKGGRVMVLETGSTGVAG